MVGMSSISSISMLKRSSRGSFRGFKTKFELLLPFLKSRNQSELVAFMDGTDIFWGGCEMSEFLHYYEKIVEYSGTSVDLKATSVALRT